VRSVDDANHNSIPDDLSNYKVARAGDLVINKMKAWQGSLGLAPIDGIVSPAYFVFHADFAVPQFGEYLLRSKPYVAKFGAASDGVRIGQWDLNIPRMRSIEVYLPPADEQAAIVKYLAHANARIDKAIAAKRRLVSLIEEQGNTHRAMLLSELGSPQRLATTLWEGPTNGVSPEVSQSGNLKTFSISVVRNGVVDVRESDVKYVDHSDVPNVAKYELRTGDVLMVRGNGNIKLVGRAALVSADIPDYIYPDLLMRLRFRPNVDPSFMVAVLNSPWVRAQIENKARTAVGSYKLSGADIRGLRVSVPEFRIQRRIVHELDEFNATGSQIVDRLEAEVTLLQEFRARLVADVVTGQVDVRGIAATLPDTLKSLENSISEFDDDLEEALSEGEE
jgi:type I restriction enzyme S subunit